MAKEKGAQAQSEASAGGKSMKPALLLKKITPVTVLDEKVAKLTPKEGEPAAELYTVFGIANGTKSGHTQFGDWTALTGMFEAVRKSDGERFQSAVCFVPGAAGDILIGGLKANREKDPEASIHFAITVAVKYMERRDGTAGYEYVTNEVVKVAQADVLADLRGKAIGFDG